MLKYSTLAVIALLVGCSSESADTHDGAHDTGAAATDSAATDTGTAATDSEPADAAPETPAVKPATPEVINVMPMAGAWHVTWKLNDTGLTKVELWRSNDGAEATLVKAFGGTAKDWHDGVAVGTTVKYCWKVKTFRNAEASDLSAEKCSK